MDNLRILIEQISEGSTQALSELYDETSSQVYSLALHVVRDRSVAEEVTSDVYLQVWRTAGSYDEGRGNPRAWLLMMARSRAVDRLRALAKSKRLEGESTDDLRDSAAALDWQRTTSVETRLSLELALSRLSSEQRRLIEIGFFEGLSHREIAQALNLPLGTVKTRIRRTLSQLRSALMPLRA